MKTDGSVIIDTKIIDGGLKKGFDLLKNQMSSVGVEVKELGDKIQLNFSDKATVAIENAVIRVKRLEQELENVTYQLSQAKLDNDDLGAEKWGNRQEAVYDRLYDARRRLASVIVKEAQKEANREIKESKRAAAEKEKAYKKATKNARQFGKRLAGIASSALLFNIISKGLRSVTEYFGKVLKTNEKFNKEVSSLKGALLTAFQPIYNFVLPALTEFVSALTDASWAIAKFFAQITGTSVKANAEAAKGLYEEADAYNAVGKSANKASKSMAGFDEINVMQSKESEDTLPDFTAVEDLPANGAKKLSDFVGALGVALASFGNLKAGGALLSIESVQDVVNGIKDISENGINWDNAEQVISGIAKIGALISFAFGNTKLGGSFLIASGLTTIITEIADNWEAIKNGDWSGVDKVELATAAITVLGGFFVAFDIFSKLTNKKGTGKEDGGPSVFTQKMKATVKDLALGIAIIAEVAVAAGLFIAAIWGLGVLLEQVGIAWQPVIDNGKTVAIAVGIGTLILAGVGIATALLGKQGGTMCGQIGIGIAILAEVAVAAGLFIGAIWGLGVLLDKVGIAWQPVIDNGETVSTAVGIGTLILVGIGLATALLGSLGGTVCGQIGIGIAILVELGIAAGLFLAEIWAIGWGLNEIYKAWRPINGKGKEIASYIGIGTGLLVGIGVVTAALGAASVASVGLLPLAVGLGTALLVELALSFEVFCDSLIDVANKLIEMSDPMDELNEILPGLKTDMEDFTSFMGDFAWAVVKFSASSAIAGIAATVDKVVDFFTTDPVQRMYEEVSDQTKEFNNLIPALEKINPLIEKATKLVGDYKENMGSFNEATGNGGGFLDAIINGAKDAVNGLISLFEGMANGVIRCINSIISGLNKIQFNVPSWVPVIGGRSFGFNINQISEISIPRLAQGAVIPPNKEFMAVLGDQKHGTNVEAPLDTIKQALAEVLALQGGGGETVVSVNFTGDLAQLARVLKPAIETETRRRGGSLAKGATF